MTNLTTEENNVYVQMHGNISKYYGFIVPKGFTIKVYGIPGMSLRCDPIYFNINKLTPTLVYNEGDFIYNILYDSNLLKDDDGFIQLTPDKQVPKESAKDRFFMFEGIIPKEYRKIFNDRKYMFSGQYSLFELCDDLKGFATNKDFKNEEFDPELPKIIHSVSCLNSSSILGCPFVDKTFKSLGGNTSESNYRIYYEFDKIEYDKLMSKYFDKFPTIEFKGIMCKSESPGELIFQKATNPDLFKKYSKILTSYETLTVKKGYYFTIFYYSPIDNQLYVLLRKQIISYTDDISHIILCIYDHKDKESDNLVKFDSEKVKQSVVNKRQSIPTTIPKQTNISLDSLNEIVTNPELKKELDYINNDYTNNKLKIVLFVEICGFLTNDYNKYKIYVLSYNIMVNNKEITSTLKKYKNITKENKDLINCYTKQTVLLLNKLQGLINSPLK